jgi:hypothetical protein
MFLNYGEREESVIYISFDENIMKLSQNKDFGSRSPENPAG